MELKIAQYIEDSLQVLPYKAIVGDNCILQEFL